MPTSFSINDMTIHRIVEQEYGFTPLFEFLPTLSKEQFEENRSWMEQGAYDAEFSLRWMQKDLHLASVSAYEAGVAMPVANVTKEIYRLAMRHGLADLDFSAVYRVLNDTENSSEDAARHAVLQQ